jgi:RNA polymerase sigma factor (sigma-70 family)
VEWPASLPPRRSPTRRRWLGARSTVTARPSQLSTSATRPAPQPLPSHTRVPADATQEAFVSVLRRLPKLEGRELAFCSYVFTSARNAGYDVIERRRRTEPSDDIPEHATPVGGGVGGGGMGFDPGDPEDDPSATSCSRPAPTIRVANLTLAERQREAPALKELEDLSYDQIAEIMGLNRNSGRSGDLARPHQSARRAARLRARLDRATSPHCERALPLIASLQDGQLEEESGDAAWLGDYLIACDSCRLGREAMEEAGLSYRAWLLIAAGPLLFRETMAEAAELVGAD